METTPRDTRSSYFDLLPTEECYDLLSSTTVGRVAFSGADGLVLLPVNYRVIGGRVLLRTAKSGALAELEHHDGEVLFEVDFHSATARDGWSVILRGTCSSVTDDATRADADLAHLDPWIDGHRDLLLAIDPVKITGRRVGGPQNNR